MNTMIINSLPTELNRSSQAAGSKSNVGGYDRLLRFALGGVLIADGLHGTGPLGIDAWLFMLSIPLIVSAIIAWDPIYALFKVRTATLRVHEVPSWRLVRMNADGGVNIGTMDRIARIALASVLLATPFIWAGPIGAIAFAGTVAGIVVMMTAVIGWDPVYQLTGVRTATLPIETAPDYSTDDDVSELTLFDTVEGDDIDVYQKAA